MLSDTWETIEEIVTRTEKTPEEVIAHLQEAARVRRLQAKMETRDGVKITLVKLVP